MNFVNNLVKSHIYEWIFNSSTIHVCIVLHIYTFIHMWQDIIRSFYGCLANANSRKNLKFMKHDFWMKTERNTKSNKKNRKNCVKKHDVIRWFNLTFPRARPHKHLIHFDLAYIAVINSQMMICFHFFRATQFGLSLIFWIIFFKWNWIQYRSRTQFKWSHSLPSKGNIVLDSKTSRPSYYNLMYKATI